MQGLDDSYFLTLTMSFLVASLALLFGGPSGWWTEVWPGHQRVSSLIPGLPLTSSLAWSCPLSHRFSHSTSTGEQGTALSHALCSAVRGAGSHGWFSLGKDLWINCVVCQHSLPSA